jgi:prepilin peptidase CpaA
MLSLGQMLPVLGTLLAVASASDVAIQRIPNALVLGVAVTGLLTQAMAAGPVGLAGAAIAAVVAGVTVWPFWNRGWIAGGDLKLAAATATWLGLRSVPAYMLVSAVAVGVVSVVCYAASAQSARAQVRNNLSAAVRGAGIGAVTLGAEEGRVRVPAGVGFAAGALVTLAMTGGL